MIRQALQAFHNFPYAILSCLNPYTASILQARQAHAHILKAGWSNDLHLVTKLLSLYADHQSFSDADHLLDSLPDPDVFCFSTLIYAYSRFNRFRYSLRLFSRMLSRGLLPDNRVVPSAVKACGEVSVLKVGQQVHGFVSTCGFALDSFVQSTLVHMYIKCHELGYAHKLLAIMPEPDVVSWSAVVAGYARQGMVMEANMAFEEMNLLGIQPNSVTWNGMISGFNQSGNFSEAVLVFEKMYLFGLKPDGTSISSVLSAVGDLEDSEMGIRIHDCVIKQGLESDNCIVSALIDMYGKCARSTEMMKVFEEMDQKDLGACNALIAGLSRNGLADVALSVFEQFQGQGMELNVVSWTSIIACCSQNGKDMEALELFRKMQMNGLEPNYVTIPCMLPACGNISALMHGKSAHAFSLRRRLFDNVYVSSALVDMYANCGRIHAAKLCFNRMAVRNLVSWNAMIGGYAMHGKAKEAIETFHWMQKTRLKPDLITFTCLLSACSHSGLTKEGEHFFSSMSMDHGIEARIEHYACMVTLLGRAGKLEEAYSMIKSMPFEPDACVWGALLSSCRVHKNMTLGEIAANNLFELEPKNPGNYVLLSNIYASNGKWDQVDRVRDLMKCMGIRKNPGCSWIEIKNEVHMLLAGDKSHAQMVQIIEKLNYLSMQMKKSGVAPITDFVLLDVEEQDKEHVLCGHSEKLAVVLGLLNTPPGSPLQVIKNLRICGDCHDVIKFISSFEGREIFVRDTYRFHHFKDGVCSCGDFW